MKKRVNVSIAFICLFAVGYFVATQDGRDAVKRYERHYVCSDRSLNYYLSYETTNWHYEQRNIYSNLITRGRFFGVSADSLQKVHQDNTARKSKIEYIRKDAVEEFGCMALWQNRDS
ncbi:hypothetical protein ST37_09155 [Vibrio sp. qd031]|uniref:hypothetical protein n=1 Tax=Vibrio sp. qd031 TaxID=1603038 RepID=UPI000A11136A|nr:hypothetical protein [Vibrio sp. qd031]ORT50075.1 hypothetical protein ST37_09155 [Vibrio sp. qd031]